MTEWREGHAGAVVMGLRHGLYCVGCCWALMAALFALGVMSIGWMVLIAAVIAIEKLLPRMSLASPVIVLVLAVLAGSVAFSPDDVPGMTTPESPEAMRAMAEMRQEDPSAPQDWSGWTLRVTDASGQIVLSLDLDGSVH